MTQLSRFALATALVLSASTADASKDTKEDFEWCVKVVSLTIHPNEDLFHEGIYMSCDAIYNGDKAPIKVKKIAEDCIVSAFRSRPDLRKEVPETVNRNAIRSKTNIAISFIAGACLGYWKGKSE